MLTKNLKCPLCGEAKEDEVHFVLCCPMLDDIRKQFIPPSSVNILAFLGLVCCWLQPTRKLSENYQLFFIRLSRLGILILSTNEPVVVNSCHLYDAKLNFFIPFLWLCIKLYVHPFMNGHGLYINKTSINQSISLCLSLCLCLSVCLSLSLSLSLCGGVGYLGVFCFCFHLLLCMHFDFREESHQ